jgi:HEPN domain-containing protein
MIAKATQEWIDNAEENYRVALREVRHIKYPAYNTVCFNAQQCVEKYLKAFLVHHKLGFPKIHELGELCRLCTTKDSTFSLIAPIVVNLNRYAVDVRYPGLESTKQDAQDAIKDMKDSRQFIRTRLGLK